MLPAPTPDDEPRAVVPVDLRELLREAERVIDHQIRALGDLDRKSEQMITLGVAALGGGLAIGLLLVREASGPVGPFVVILLAALANLVALAMFVNAYVGAPRPSEAHVGPSLNWLQQKANDPDWTGERHYISVLADHATYGGHNLGMMKHAARWRRQGLAWLGGALIGYLASLVFILGGRIWFV